MQIRKLAWLLSGTAAMLSLFAVVPEVRGEITNLIEQPAPHLKTGQRLISSDNLELQCWQQGMAKQGNNTRVSVDKPTKT